MSNLETDLQDDEVGTVDNSNKLLFFCPCKIYFMIDLTLYIVNKNTQTTSIY